MYREAWSSVLAQKTEMRVKTGIPGMVSRFKVKKDTVLNRVRAHRQ